MIYRVRHLTTVRYAGQVRLARLNIRLRPANWPGQLVEDYTLTVTPAPADVQDDHGPFIVNRSRVTIREALKSLAIESSFRVTVNAPPVPDEAGPTLERVREQAMADDNLGPLGPAHYVYGSPIAGIVPAIADWAAPCFAPGTGIIAAARALMAAFDREFTFDGTATTPDTAPADAFAQRRGVCQDFAHIMIIAARAHGIPAAYVSGYLRTIPPAGTPRLVGADAMHAWVNLWCGTHHGWIGFDPTNDMIAGQDHIFVAMGRDYTDVAPLDGVFHGGGGQAMRVSVDVEPLAG